MKQFSEDYLNTILDDGYTIREHIEQGYKNEKIRQQLSSNPKFHRTYEEQEQSFIFLQKYTKKIKKIEDKIYWSKDNTIRFNERNKFSIILAIMKCNKSIYYYKKLKNFCYKHNGKIYFQDHWEYCHNSNNECFEFIQSTKEFKFKLMNLLKNKNG